MEKHTFSKEIAEEDLCNLALIRTSVGACLRGQVKGTGHKVSVKLLSCDPSRESDWSQFIEEAQLLASVRSERVLVPLGVYRSGCLQALAWDWMSNGSLHSLLHETHLYPDVPMSVRLQILLDVAEGLQHLHSLPLPHRALRATNVLLDQQYRAKLCDAGTSVSRSSRPCVRVLAYLALDVMQGAAPSVQSDVYGFGVLLWETLNRKSPCEGLEQLQALVLSALERGMAGGVEEDFVPPVTPHGHALTQLMRRCLDSEPRNRPSAKECVLQLRKAMKTFDPKASARAAVHLKECKERELLSCKHAPPWEMPIEINNLLGFSGCPGSKHMVTKTIPATIPQRNIPETLIPSPLDVKGQESCTIPIATTSRRHTGCYRAESPSPPPVVTPSPPCSDRGFTQCCRDWGLPQRQSLTPPGLFHGSPAAMTKGLQQQVRVHCQEKAVCRMSSEMGGSCCRLLQERRETIVQRMTEGRLNNLLDVLRAKQVVSQESYELIMAALTPAARTRRLLDTCACLGENVAVLVATSLGLVSVGTKKSHA